MHFASEFTFKQLSTAAPGELVSFPYGGGEALAMVLAKLDNGNVHCGVLRAADPDFPKLPFHTITEPSGYCLSFGESWELELIPTAETWSGNSDYRSQSGVIHLDDSMTILRFGHPPNKAANGAREFDLRSWGKAPVIQNYVAPILKWKLWARQGISTHPKTEPIFAFEAVQKQ